MIQDSWLQCQYRLGEENVHTDVSVCLCHWYLVSSFYLFFIHFLLVCCMFFFVNKRIYLEHMWSSYSNTCLFKFSYFATLFGKLVIVLQFYFYVLYAWLPVQRFPSDVPVYNYSPYFEFCFVLLTLLMNYGVLISNRYNTR